MVELKGHQQIGNRGQAVASLKVCNWKVPTLGTSCVMIKWTPEGNFIFIKISFWAGDILYL